MSACFWLFIICAVVAVALYEDGDTDYDNPLEPLLPEAVIKIWSVALIGNGILSLFPTFWCIFICNIFGAKVVANQAWNVANVFGSIMFFQMRYEGVCMMMFVMGWSVSMF